MSSKKFDYQQRFDGVAEYYDSSSNRYCVKRRLRFFKSHALGKCLEVGAATGGIISELKSPTFVLGTDLSYQMVCKMSEKGVTGFQSDAEALPVKSEVLDSIIASEVVYYLDNPTSFFCEAYRVLRKEGILLLSSFNNDVRFYGWLRKLLRGIGIKQMYFDDGVNEFLTGQEITEMLGTAGFKDTKIMKTIVFPTESLESVNRLLERTVLRHIGLFLFVSTKK